MDNIWIILGLIVLVLLVLLGVALVRRFKAAESSDGQHSSGVSGRTAAGAAGAGAVGAGAVGAATLGRDDQPEQEPSSTAVRDDTPAGDQDAHSVSAQPRHAAESDPAVGDPAVNDADPTSPGGDINDGGVPTMPADSDREYFGADDDVRAPDGSPDEEPATDFGATEPVHTEPVHTEPVYNEPATAEPTPVTYQSEPVVDGPEDNTDQETYVADSGVDSDSDTSEAPVRSSYTTGSPDDPDAGTHFETTEPADNAPETVETSADPYQRESIADSPQDDGLDRAAAADLTSDPDAAEGSSYTTGTLDTGSHDAGSHDAVEDDRAPGQIVPASDDSDQSLAGRDAAAREDGWSDDQPRHAAEPEHQLDATPEGNESASGEQWYQEPESGPHQDASAESSIEAPRGGNDLPVNDTPSGDTADETVNLEQHEPRSSEELDRDIAHPAAGTSGVDHVTEVPAAPGNSPVSPSASEPEAGAAGAGGGAAKLQDLRHKVQDTAKERWNRPGQDGQTPGDKFGQLRDKVEGEVRNRMQNRGEAQGGDTQSGGAQGGTSQGGTGSTGGGVRDAVEDGIRRFRKRGGDGSSGQ
ncbi:hypothetical protein [Demetria terragena]|uniref:hypothetical protein n=1 Tax=Demetria terragena TaxID=63959 RepID=UPI00037CF6A6|nr:hypothetical protein [Demetria terragena]